RPRGLFGRDLGLEGADRLADGGRDVALDAAGELGAVGLGHRGGALHPLAAGRLAARADLAPGAEDRLGDVERPVAPTELLAGARDLVLAEPRAAGGGGPGLGRRAT